MPGVVTGVVAIAILLVLSLGGLALLWMTWWVALAVCALLVIVVASYRQTCYAYPNGGGAYAVSKANLGSHAALRGSGHLPRGDPDEASELRRMAGTLRAGPERGLAAG